MTSLLFRTLRSLYKEYYGIFKRKMMNDDEKEINQTNHLPAAFGSFVCLFVFPRSLISESVWDNDSDVYPT